MTTEQIEKWNKEVTEDLRMIEYDIKIKLNILGNFESITGALVDVMCCEYTESMPRLSITITDNYSKRKNSVMVDKQINQTYENLRNRIKKEIDKHIETGLLPELKRRGNADRFNFDNEDKELVLDIIMNKIFLVRKHFCPKDERRDNIYDTSEPNYA